jgi:hypothetical protein
VWRGETRVLGTGLGWERECGGSYGPGTRGVRLC